MAEEPPFPSSYPNSFQGIGNYYAPSSLACPSNQHWLDGQWTQEDLMSFDDPMLPDLSSAPSVVQNVTLFVSPGTWNGASFVRGISEVQGGIQTNTTNFHANRIGQNNPTNMVCRPNVFDPGTWNEVSFVRGITGVQGGIQNNTTNFHANRIGQNNPTNMVSHPNVFDNVQNGDPSHFSSHLYSSNLEGCPPNKSWVDSSGSGEAKYIFQNTGLLDQNHDYLLLDLRTVPSIVQSANPLMGLGSTTNTTGQSGLQGGIEIHTNSIKTDSRTNKINMATGHWTEEENILLRKLVEKFGLKSWSQIAKTIPGRTARQCRERWNNHLKPNIEKGAWTVEEEIILVDAHKLIGNKWTEIAERLPGRTENTIKNHWYATKRRRLTNARKRRVSSRYTNGSTLLQNYISSLNNNLSAGPTPNVVASGDDLKHILFDQNSVSVSPGPTLNVVASGNDPNHILFDQNLVSANSAPMLNVVASEDDPNLVSASPKTPPEDKQNLIEKKELKDYPNQAINNTGVSSSDCQALDTDVV